MAMIQGAVDGLDRHLVCGWAYDPSLPDSPVVVAAFLGDRLLFRTEADAWRSDLAEAGMGNGRHFFLHAFPEPIAENKLFEISVFAGEQKLPINHSPEQAPSKAFIVGWIENLDQNGVAGWVYNTAASDHSVSVAVQLGDRLLDLINADLFRPDLQAANIPHGRHGFRYPFREEIPEQELSKVVVRAGGVELPRYSPLQPFHSSLRDHATSGSRFWSQSVVYPVALRRTFEVSCDSVIGQVMRLLYKEFPPSADRINPILNDLFEVVKSNNHERLHIEKLSVDFGQRIEEVEISRTNTNFIGVDRGVREFRQGYEPEILAIIDLLVPDDGVLLDIGANWGCFSIFLAARPGFSGRVYAFEPASQSFQNMAKLVEDLKLKDHIVCQQLGLADYSGIARLSVGLMSGLSSISDSVADNYAVSYEEVQISRLDDLSIPNAYLIKIDVEGVEAEVIRGGERYINKAKPAIILENWIFPGDPKKTSEPLDILASWGYEFFLPCWTNPEKTLFSSIPLGETRDQLLALCPFEIKDRQLFNERVNILALSKDRFWERLTDLRRLQQK